MPCRTSTGSPVGSPTVGSAGAARASPRRCGSGSRSPPSRLPSAPGSRPPRREGECECGQGAGERPRERSEDLHGLSPRPRERALLEAYPRRVGGMRAGRTALSGARGARPRSAVQIVWRAIQRVTSSISARISASLRPLRAGTWNEWSASSNSRSVARAPSRSTTGSQQRRGRRARRACPAGTASAPRRRRGARRARRRLAGGVQREAEEHQAAHAGQRRRRLRLRGHPAAERLAAGEQRQRRASARPLGDRGAHGGVGDRRRVGPLRAALHVGNW